jgi:hypothetical protein
VGGWQLIAYYRTINRRRRPRVPRYFDNESDKNHKPEFVSVPIEEYGKQPQPSPSLAAQKSKP